ncbi:hypothetical protein OH77DRAFT_1585904 [Trametes cingulata]|nr:hypothetical protein OH77DRAFT_1585904 [Trametes cingulata]
MSPTTMAPARRRQDSRASPGRLGRVRRLAQCPSVLRACLAVSKAFQPIVISSDDDDDEVSRKIMMTKTRRRPRSQIQDERRETSPAAQGIACKTRDADIDDLLDGDVTRDSIMDSSEDEEADEVDNIL